MFLKRIFCRNDWIWSSELVSRQKVKIDLTLKDFRRRRNFQRQHQQLFNNRKSKIENRTSEIENCCSGFDSDQSTIWNLNTNSENERFQKQKLFLNLLNKDLRFENNFNDDQTTVAKTLLKTHKQRAIDFDNLFEFYWSALTKKYQLLTKMLNLLHQKRRNFETQLFINNWRFFSLKTLLSRKSSRSRRFNSK